MAGDAAGPPAQPGTAERLDPHGAKHRARETNCEIPATTRHSLPGAPSLLGDSDSRDPLARRFHRVHRFVAATRRQGPDRPHRPSQIGLDGQTGRKGGPGTDREASGKLGEPRRERRASPAFPIEAGIGSCSTENSRLTRFLARHRVFGGPDSLVILYARRKKSENRLDFYLYLVEV
jgi:hypothetical protein